MLLCRLKNFIQLNFKKLTTLLSFKEEEEQTQMKKQISNDIRYQIIKQKDNKETLEQTCNICLDVFNILNIENACLDCGCVIHMECFNNFLEVGINSRDINFKFPNTTCQKPINPKIICPGNARMSGSVPYRNAPWHQKDKEEPSGSAADASKKRPSIPQPKPAPRCAPTLFDEKAAHATAVAAEAVAVAEAVVKLANDLKETANNDENWRRKHYKELIKQWHPDKNQEQTKMTQISFILKL